ncbi:MAG: hypothetical protein WEB90_04975 [Gemmatimonadota bacterium]
MRALHRNLGTVLMALGMSACASTSEPAERPAGDPFAVARGAPTDEVLLTVENNDFRDATIYVSWNGARRRAGTVTGKSSETFRMDWRSEWVQLQVDFLGGGGYTTERVDVVQGDHLNFVIMPSP